jgi:tetratricopeptide (TPR) repeat protein
MTKDDPLTEKEWHRKFAADAFNLTWDLLDKDDRTEEDDDRMVYAAHASRFHWGEIGTPLEWERGEWQISRVYAVLNRPEAAIRHAQRCLALCEENSIGDFDLAFAYEGLARAYAVAGNAAESRQYVELARQAGERIEDEGNRTYFFGELVTVSSLLA